MATETIEQDEDLEAKRDRFIKDIKMDADDQLDQRELAHEDFVFVTVPGGTWIGEFGEQFSDDRVKLEFQVVPDVVAKFNGEWNKNRVGVEYKPDDDLTTDKDAELMNGIYRADYRQGNGKSSVDNAVDELAKCGMGSWVLRNKFEDEGDPENDNQRIVWGEINNSYERVYWGPSSNINKSDATRCTVLTPFTKSSFEEIYKDKLPISAYKPENLEHFTRNGDHIDIIYIATRYEVIKKKIKVFVYNNLRTGKVESFTEDQHGEIEEQLKKDELRQFKRERVITKRQVFKSVFSGKDFLEEPRKIAGEWIPVITAYGKRAFVNGVEYFQGLVGPLKDPARVLNVQISQIAENAATLGQEIPILTQEQVQGLEKFWDDKNNLGYLVINKTTDADGREVAMPPVGYLKPPSLDGNTAALMEFVPNFIQSMTGGAPQDTLDPNASGKAINAVIQQSNLRTQDFFDNISNAIEWSGVVYQSMASDIYSKQQMVRVIGKDGTENREMLFKTVQDEDGKLVESNVLTGKKFSVYSDVGPQYESLREQTVDDIKGMIELLIQAGSAAQKYVPLLVALSLENMSGVGMDRIKKVVRQDMLLMGLQEPENDEEKAFVEASQGQGDGQKELVQAVTQQAQAEAQKLLSEGRNLDSKSISNIMDARKKAAETAKIQGEIVNNRAKTFLEIENQIPAAGLDQ